MWTGTHMMSASAENTLTTAGKMMAKEKPMAKEKAPMAKVRAPTAKEKAPMAVMAMMPEQTRTMTRTGCAPLKNFRRLPSGLMRWMELMKVNGKTHVPPATHALILISVQFLAWTSPGAITQNKKHAGS